MYLEKSLIVAREKGELLFEGLSQVFLGRVMAEGAIAERSQATAEIWQGTQLLESLHLRVFAAVGHLFLGQVYLLKGDVINGRAHLETARNVLTEVDEEYWLYKAQEALASLK